MNDHNQRLLATFSLALGNIKSSRLLQELFTATRRFEGRYNSKIPARQRQV
jgi:hypothetical protein